MRMFVVGLLGLLLAGAVGLATTLRVPTDYATIQEAVDKAASGDTILISPGIYQESVVVQNKNGITIKGDISLNIPDEYKCCPPIWDEVGKVLIKGPFQIVNSTDITVESLTVSPFGFIIKGTTNIPSTDITLKYVQIINSYKVGLHLIGHYKNISILESNISRSATDGVYLADYGATILIEKCCINENGRTRPTGVGIRVSPHIEGLVIRDNCLVKNAFAAIHPG